MTDLSKTVTELRPTLPFTPADEALADAVAADLVRYAVAYSHNTLADLSTADRTWGVHETGHGNPFEHDVWNGKFDNKQDAHALASKLRRNAAIQTVAAHRIAAVEDRDRLREAAVPIIASLERSEASFHRNAAGSEEPPLSDDDGVCIRLGHLRALRTALSASRDMDRGEGVRS